MDFGLLASIVGIRVAQLAFGGGLLWSTLLLTWSNRVEHPGQSAAADRAYLDLSLAMSIGLTVLVFSTIVHHYLVLGGFSLPLDTLPQKLTAIQYAVFLALWIHWGYVEIVILQRFRAEMPAVGNPVTPLYRRTRIRVRKAHGLQLFLFLVMVVLESAALVADRLVP